MTATKRNTGYDLLRFISICMVVVIHANVSFLGQDRGSASWFVVMLFTALCSLSVPLFFMLSGALLLGKDETVSLKELYTKRIPKQAVPFILWSIIYIVARIVMGKIDFSLNAFVSLLWEPAYYQFWFMYTLLGIYLLLPVLQILVKNLSKRMLEYALLLWFVFAIVIPTASYIVPQFSISGHVDLILCEGYIGYFLLGHYLHKYGEEVSRVKAAMIAVIGIAAVLLCAAAEWFVCANDAYGGYFYQSYLTPSVVVAAIGAFLLFGKSFVSAGEKTRKIAKILSENALGVYYIHMLVLTVLESMVLKAVTMPYLAARIVLSIGISLVVAWVISKIPVMNTLLCCVQRKS